MELEKYGIPNELAERIIQGIVEGQYNLLLGAGFSMSAFDSSNRNLPSGPALARELTGEFKTGLIDPDASNLTLAFDEAKHSAKEGKLAEFLRSRFSGAKPTWHSVVMEFPWTRIWSLNIDDLFEHENFRKDGRALPHPITWKDKLEVPSAEKKTLQVVHLHGSVSSFGGDLSKLVFSIREYAKAVRENGDWHSEFWSQWLQKPFLVIGARLVDEFDLNEAISAGNNSETATGLKSLAVVLNPSGTDRRRLERAKLLVVDATAEDFFSALLQDVTDFRKRNVDLPEFPVPAISAARFNQQFEALSLERGFSKRRVHDFYGGDEPVWKDIVENLDGQRRLTDRIIPIVSGAAEKQVAVVLTGAPGAGRSTALLRAANEFAKMGYKIFKHREEERPDTGVVLDWIKANPRTILIFDNAADFSGDIGKILGQARNSGISCHVVVAERASRSDIIKADLSSFLSETLDYSRVARTDALSICDVRRKHARMGQATGWSDKEIWKLFKEKDEDLFLTLAEIEQGVGFYSRLDAEWNKATKGASAIQLRVAYAIASVHRHGYSLPFKTVIDVAGGGASSLDEVGMDNGGFSEIVIADTKGYKFRHRMFSEHVYRRSVNARDKYDITQAVAASLAPLLSPGTMRARTYPYLILRALMDKASVISSSGNVERAREWYRDLEPQFSWNGRYWDQRALLESEFGAHAQAYSYAKKSVSLHRHPFSLNTLGLVRLKASLDDSYQLDSAWELFLEGVAALRESIAHAQGYGDMYEHPYVTFFEYTVKFSERLLSSDYRAKQLFEMVVDWEREADRLALSNMYVRINNAKARVLKKIVKKG